MRTEWMYYRSFNDEMKERFGRKVYKLSLDAGFTCPNRDGTAGYGGCTFCRAGSGDFAQRIGDDISSQIEAAKARVSSKNPGGLYMAYFQSYTNTYAPAEKLRDVFIPVAQRGDICAVSVATRPDCLNEGVMDVLREVSSIKPLMVELGLQTSNEDTAVRINRCYPLSVFDDGIKALKDAGIETVAHMIIGLPGEGMEEAVSTARHIAGSGADGIKFHMLHILKDTKLYEEYLRGDVPVLSIDRYIDILEECIMAIRPDMTVHRLTGDGAKKYLAAPMWSADKKKVLNEIQRRFTRDDIIQGKKYNTFAGGNDGQKIC